MSKVIRIAAAANTLAPAHSELVKLGFLVTQIATLPAEPSMIRATRADLVLEAEDTLQLLGLATLAERRGASWEPTANEVDAFMRLEG